MPDLTLTEKIKNVSIAVGAVSALILGIVANFKGEPIAEKTWTTLRLEVNKHTETINKLNEVLVQMQAREEGKTIGTLLEQLSRIQNDYDSLSNSVNQSPCKPGYTRLDNICKKVSKSVQVNEDLKAEVKDEKRKRLSAEKKKIEIIHHFQQKNQADNVKRLEKLPLKLSEQENK